MQSVSATRVASVPDSIIAAVLAVRPDQTCDETAQSSFIEGLLGVTPNVSRHTRGREWWTLRRHGRNRYYLPVARHAAEALNLLASPRNRALMRLNARLGLPLGTRVHGSLDAAPIASFTDEVLRSRDFWFGVHCGTPSIFQKYTIQCIAADGSTRAFIKIADGPAAGSAITNEVELLKRLAGFDTLASSVPRVLYSGIRWNRHVSVLSPAPSDAARYHAGREVELFRFARDVSQLDDLRCSWQESPVRHELTACAHHLDRLGHAEASDHVLQGVARLDALLGHDLAPQVRAHGDFLPWNVLLGRSVFVLDWEWSRMALPFYDVWHLLSFPTARSLGARGTLRQSPDSRHRAWMRAAGYASGDIDEAATLWWQAYAVQAFAFYAASAAAAGNLATGSALLNTIRAMGAKGP